MAVDTAAKRLSMLDFCGAATMPGLPLATGSFDQADRQHLIWLYSGIAAGAGPAEETAFAVWSPNHWNGRRRKRAGRRR